MLNILPSEGNIVVFTDEIIELLRGNSPFEVYAKEKLVIIEVRKSGSFNDKEYKVTFKKALTSLEDVIYILENGTISGPTSKEMASVLVFRLYEGPSLAKVTPLNNDGREKCFWCNAQTRKVFGFVSTYDVCSSCGR